MLQTYFTYQVKLASNLCMMISLQTLIQTEMLFHMCPILEL